MAGLVASHLVHGVMNRIQVGSLSLFSQLKLAQGSAVLGSHTHLQVLLGRGGHHLAQHLGELGSVLCLFISGLFPVETDLRVALTVCHSGHSQVHTHLGAFAVKVVSQALDDLLVHAVDNAYLVLGSPSALLVLPHGHLSAANGANINGGVALIPAYRAIILFAHNRLSPF